MSMNHFFLIFFFRNRGEAREQPDKICLDHMDICGTYYISELHY